MENVRREIKTRDTKWARELAKFLCEKTNLTPNAISVLSVIFSILAFFDFCLYPILNEKFYPILAIFGIIFIQLRLLCNLMDGMVAIEGGKKSPVGDIYNEFPDRLSDSFIIIGFGVMGETTLSLVFGLLGALFAMFTAYTRVLGGAIGVEQKFLGPMAKQHRMALLTFGSFICIFEFLLKGLHTFISPAFLIIVTIGSAITVKRRVDYIAKCLMEKNG